MAIVKEQNPDIITIDPIIGPLLRLQIEHK